MQIAPIYTNTTTNSRGSTTSTSSRSAVSLELLANTSNSVSTSTTPPVCCFVVQDVVSEEWWGMVTTSSVYKVVNLSLITAHVTSWPGTTTTSYETNVQTTNASFPFTIELGYNPISLFDNDAPQPTEITYSNNGTALITGGVTV